MKRARVFSLLVGILLAPALASAQSLSGNVAAADTGAPLTLGTVVAIRVAAAAGQRPAIFKTNIDSTGRYNVPVSAGKYRLCVYGAAPYLDPCIWGGAATPTVSAAAVSAPLSLQKGVELIVRVHDPNRLLSGAEVVHGGAVQAYLVTPSILKLPLPLLSDTGIARDYGMFIPFNTALTVFAVSASLRLASSSGAAFQPSGIPVQVSPADFRLPNPLPAGLARVFPRPTARVVHVYAGAVQ